MVSARGSICLVQELQDVGDIREINQRSHFMRGVLVVVLLASGLESGPSQFVHSGGQSQAMFPLKFGYLAGDVVVKVDRRSHGGILHHDAMSTAS
jgi:hypothetical protein